MVCRLDALPKELLSQIAVESDVLSIIRLSQACRTLRSACYDSLVFRELLKDQACRWTIDSLDFDAIDSRCGKDACLWARFALADQRAWELAQKESPLETPDNFLNWLPELLVVKHPLMYQQFWGRFLWNPQSLTTAQMFCFAMAILAQPQEPMQQLEKSLAMHDQNYFGGDESSKAYFWGLCFTILRLRKLLNTRRAAWPYNNAASVPYIALPTVSEIDMRPTSASYQLPLPFSDPAAATSNWNNWYVAHNREMGKEYLFDGTWRGYYTYFRSFIPSLDQLDPPMAQIRFVRQQLPDGDPTDALEIAAEDCVDGVGQFAIIGSISQVDDVFTFHGTKAYGGDITDGMGANITWDWKLKLTPLGLVGYWGIAQADDELERNGSVWLWKTPS